MKPDEKGAYDTFLHTGRIADYLNYIDVKQHTQGIATAENGAVTGENGAYYDRRDRSAGTSG
ncbi:hypothetical protein V6615_02130 [Oscillospiraceae bacterium PP1C4]